jgi:integrase/recombinase XerD
MGYFVYQVNSYSDRDDRKGRERNAVSLLYDRDGNRKYLTVSERSAFLYAASKLPPMERTFCLILAYTGARISEVLALTPARIDVEARVVVLESLKKRRRGHFRAIPLPSDLLSEFDTVHDTRSARRDPDRAQQPMWVWCRTTAWGRVKGCMAEAEITGPRATAKGLRHSFAVASLQAGVHINFVRKWLGHSRLSTTEIYADAVGDEELSIAHRFWKTFSTPTRPP